MKTKEEASKPNIAIVTDMDAWVESLLDSVNLEIRDETRGLVFNSFLHLGDSDTGASGKIEGKDTRVVFVDANSINEALRNSSEGTRALIKKIEERLWVFHFDYPEKPRRRIRVLESLGISADRLILPEEVRGKINEVIRSLQA